MDGMLKEVPVARPTPVINTTPSPSIGKQESTLPMEMYRYFDVNPASNDKFVSKHLETIHKWAVKDNPDLTESMYKIRTLEQKLGSPALDEHRYTRLYNYIRMQGFIDSVNDERDSYKKHASNKYDVELKKIEIEKSRVKAEIERKKKEELNRINRQSQVHLKQLGKLQSIYTR